MAYGNPGNPGMEEGYEDAGPAQSQPMEKEGDKDEQETALLPESILMGKKFEVGEEVVLKIVAKHEGQIEVTYASEEGSKEEEAGETPAEERAEMAQGGGGGGDSEMGQMMY